MRILPIGYSAPKINFGAKKTLYTDYDGTYFPFDRKEINEWYKDSFSKMYTPFNEIKKQDDEFSIVVTTGRNKNDFLHTQQKITDEGLDYCLPDGLISSNGANSFIIKQNGGQIAAIDITDNGEQFDITSKAIEIIEQANPDATIFECDINGMEETYGKGSLETKLDKLYIQNKAHKYVSIVRDGKYNSEIVFSKNADDDTSADRIQEYIEENNLPFTVEHYENSPFTIVPEYDNYKQKNYVCANLIMIKYNGNKKGIPDKVDIIKDEVKKAMDAKKGDVVIVAGDGFNDEKMLNPLNYLDLIGYDKTGRKEEDVINDGRVIQGLKRMPLKTIITGNDPALDHLRELGHKLDVRGVHTIKIAPDSKVDFAQAVEKIVSESNSK